jgi:polyisoprenoid-binding protein YceI
MRAFVFVMIYLAALPAVAGDWKLQDTGTFTFEASFEGEPIEGRFTDFDVALDFDPEQAADSSLQVTVYLGAADMGDPDMNDAIAAPEWFTVEGFPQARFASDDIVEIAPGSFVAHGALELKGKRHDVDVPFTWSGTDNAATMHGELTLKRMDFDIGTGEWASGEQIGNEVLLRFDLPFERAD